MPAFFCFGKSLAFIPACALFGRTARHRMVLYRALRSLSVLISPTQLRSRCRTLSLYGVLPLLLALLFPAVSVAECIPISEARQHVGEDQCVTGKVLRVKPFVAHMAVARAHPRPISLECRKEADFFTSSRYHYALRKRVRRTVIRMRNNEIAADSILGSNLGQATGGGRPASAQFSAQCSTSAILSPASGKFRKLCALSRPRLCAGG